MPVQSAIPSHPTHGVKVLNVQGPYYGYVPRTDPKWGGFEPADRVYRTKWLKDQVFSPKDGVKDITRHPGYYNARVNIIRRALRAPMDMFEESLRSLMSGPKALLGRTAVSYVARGFIITWAVAYSLKYGKNDWTRQGGFKVTSRRPAIYPGDANWPNVPNKKPNEYYDNGFSESAFAKL
eukprot:TRINITY_DN2569_c0_g1_i1.p1 TRINITY_DN2569_c0_g1~~TRINITY_DN2569_c0_g1_i1.p1  ORF type:complete len:197 (+),score=39.02 TRINITY_DN2569_c0_g1_i1:52-591(+)